MEAVQERGYRLQLEDTHLVISQRVNASIERVFACFTEAKLLAQWHAPGTMTVPEAEIDLCVGGAYHITMENTEGERFTAYGEFRDIQPPDEKGRALLVYSWAWRHVTDSPATQVTIELTAHGEQTAVSLRHEGFPRPDVAEHHSEGWSKIFTRLQAFCGDPE